MQTDNHTKQNQVQYETQHYDVSIFFNTSCSGCKEDQPNQLAHINCPDGCLHDRDDCSYCDTSDEG